MRISYYSIVYFFIGSLLFSSCEDVVDIDYNVPTGTIYNIDAFINDGSFTQTIQILESPNFLDNSEPIPVENAEILVKDHLGNVYEFRHQTDGLYTWTPDSLGILISTQEPTELTVTIGSSSYKALNIAGNVPSIDSLTFEEDDFAFAEEGAVVAEFWATDVANEDNYYWAKMAVNHSYLDDTYDQNKLAHNGAYDESSDDIQFIPPVRSYDLEAANGDTVRMELLGINLDTYEFLSETFELRQNSGQFAVPYYNPRCNLIGNENSAEVIGWFGVARVSTFERVYDLE